MFIFYIFDETYIVFFLKKLINPTFCIKGTITRDPTLVQIKTKKKRGA
jgi:hypothetical protein